MKNITPELSTQNTILNGIASGNEGAVSACMDKYGNFIWSLAKKYTNNPQDAEDAVQEIFVEIWQNACRYDASKSAEITFIATIAKRRLIDRLRKHYRQPSISSFDEIFESAPNSFETQLNTQIEAGRAMQAMKSLKTEQKGLMLMNVYEGMSHGEIAESTGLPLGTVKTHIRRGFTRVREMLERKPMRLAAA